MAANTILDDDWPPDLDPATVPFKQRTVTVLRRAGLFDDWSRFDDLTEVEVAGWWNSGPVTVEDLRTTGNAAIAKHHREAGLRERMERDLEGVAREPWARHVWRKDPRFGSVVPAGGAVFEIAIGGSAVVRRELWAALGDIRRVVGHLGARSGVVSSAFAGYCAHRRYQHFNQPTCVQTVSTCLDSRSAAPSSTSPRSSD